MRTYSRFVRSEEKKNLRRSLVLGLITLALIIIFFFFGLPLIAKITGFLADLRKTSTPIESQDTTPPAPPRFNPVPESTNQIKLEISGFTEPGLTVFLTVNGQEKEILSNADGQFLYTFQLVKGENTLSAYAKDGAGNKSQKSDTVKIIFDDENPSLEITSPKDGDSFFGAKQRQVVIEGKTEEEAELTINDRFVLIEDDGIFAFTTTLSEGENTFNLKVRDKADNLTEKTIKMSFTP